MIYLDDATVFLCKLPDESVDCIITDPAYESLEVHRDKPTRRPPKPGGKRKPRLKSWFEIFPNDRLPAFLHECFRVLKKDRHLYVFCDDPTSDIVKPLATAAGFRRARRLVWNKGQIGMGYGYRRQFEFVVFARKGKRGTADKSIPDCLTVPPVRNGYPTEKPVELLETYVWQSTNEGELVVDPFCGSGSTGEAALKLGCRFLGCDVSPEAVERATRRLEEVQRGVQV